MGADNNCDGVIYTLAQNRTALPDKEIKIYGTGTEIENNPAVLKRANKKVISNALVRAMADISKDSGDNEMARRYWNTYYCQNKLISYKGRYYTDYCKNRWCATCCGIRKAHILNKYYIIIKGWEEPHLLTLTVKSVRAEKLQRRINEVITNLEKIIDRCNKRSRRGKGMKLVFIKSLECNFNATEKSYNPHYHIITPNYVTAKYLEQEWRKEWNKQEFNAGSKGQHISKINNVESGLVEVIKYGAKILCDPDPATKRKRGKGDMTGLNIYANALHTIYKAFDKHRLYGSIGFKLLANFNNDQSFKSVSDYETWLYKPQQMDWISEETDKNLTEYQIDSYLDYILKSSIDTQLH